MFHRLAAAIALAAAGALAGCSNSAAPPKNGEQANGAANAGRTAAPELVLVVTIQKGSREDYETESIKSFPDPSAAQVEELVRAQDWNNAERWPNVGLSRTTAKRLSRIRLQGLRGSTDPELTLRAEWTESEGEQHSQRRSPPLKSLEDAIRLLEAYRSEDPALKTMTEWADIPQE